MKRSHFVVACMMLAFTGCTCGQGWNCWRPGALIGRLHDRIHGSNVGAPCMSGACAAPAIEAPAMADAGCETCGNTHGMSYGNYPSAYDGEIVGSSYGGTVVGSSMPSEVIPGVRH